MSDIENFRQAVQRLDELLVELERLDDKLSSSFTDYKTLFAELTRVKDIIQSITLLQGKSVDIIDKINAVAKNTQALNDNTIITLKRELSSFKTEIGQIVDYFDRSVKTAINNIDFSKFENQVEAAFETKVKEIGQHTELLDAQTARFAAINRTLETTLTKIGQSTKNSIEQFEQQAKTLPLYILALVSVISFILGMAAFMYIGIDTFKAQVFKSELAAENAYKQKIAEVDEALKSSDGVQKFLTKNAIVAEFNVFSDTKAPYVAFKKDAIDHTFSRDDFFFVAFRDTKGK